MFRSSARSGNTVDLYLDLSPIRREVGDKWENVEPLVLSFAERAITRSLAGNGHYKLEGNRFLIRFAGVTRTAAVRHLEKIERELARVLFGTGEEDDLPARDRTPQQRGRRRKRRRFRPWFGWLSRVGSLFRIGDPDFSETDFEAAGSPYGGNFWTSDSVPQIRAQTGHNATHADEEETAETEPGSTPPDAASASAEAKQRAAAGAAAPHGDAAERKGAHDRQGRANGERRNGAAENGGQSGQQPEPRGKTSSAGASRPAADNGYLFSSAKRTAGDGYWEARSEQEFDFSNAVPRSSRAAGRARSAATRALEQALAEAARQAEREAESLRRASPFPPPGTKIIFRPNWFVTNNMLSIYRCLPAAAIGPFEFASGKALLPPKHEKRHLATLDLLVLRGLCAKLHELGDARPQILFLLPVHYETLIGEMSGDYLGLLAGLPKSFRNIIVVEIVNVHQGIGQVRTKSLIKKLRSIVRAVIGQLTLNETNFAVWRDTDLAYVGLDLEDDDRSDEILINEINHFATGAFQEGLKTYVHGIRKRSLVTAAVMNGFLYIEGPVVSEGEIDPPLEARAFSITDIYDPIRGRTGFEAAQEI